MKKPIVWAGLVLAGWCASAENLCVEPVQWEKGLRNFPWYEAAKHEKETFTTTLVIPEGHERSRWNFEAEGASGNYSISVNGEKVGEAQAPFIRFRLSNLHAGTNTVSFHCQRGYEGLATITPETNPFRERRLRKGNTSGKFGNYHLGFRGSERFRELASPVDITLAWAETSVRKKLLTIKARVDAEEAFTGVVDCRVMDADGTEVLHFKDACSFEKGEGSVELVQPWTNPKLWDIDQGNLYTAHVRLLTKAGEEVDALKPFRFGFRELWAEGREVMLNGHPLHLRLELWWMPLNEDTYGFFKYLGRNAYYLQPHPNPWWGPWGEVASTSQKLYDFCDERGILTVSPAPQVSHAAELADANLHANYAELTSKWCDIFRNHPSLIAWSVSMNAYNPKQSIVPNLLGRREPLYYKDNGGKSVNTDNLGDLQMRHVKAYNIQTAARLCKEADPTRLVYAHADGNIGDFGSGNCYPNWTPLQEIEEYPLAWTKDGDMPWFAAEYGVYSGSFFKDQRLLLTEYAAMYFGEQAYDRETQEQLEKTLDFGAKGGTHGGNLISDVAKTSSLYWDLIRLSTEGTDRYWRVYGMFGWAHFFGSRYGQPDKWKLTEPTKRDEAPKWANPHVAMHAKNMQDLLAFIGGDEVPSDKTHAFYEGEEVRKNIVCVWDGAQATTVDATWKVTDASGAVVASGVKSVLVGAGRVQEIPIRFTVPKRGARHAYKIELKASNAACTMTDEFAFEGFPRGVETVSGSGNVYLYDPRGKSQWVSQVLKGAKPYRPGQGLEADDLLVIGREALDGNEPLPYRMADVANGARVLVLEQTPVLWEGFGFRMADMMTRLVFASPYSRELMEGLAEDDLRYWRGSPDLLPEYAHVREVAQPPKGVNRHGVASTVFEIPNAHGFEPLFQCEFDLRYTPLLRFRSGKGCVYYSSFDFTDRFGTDPAATRLANNLLKLATKKTEPADRRVLVNDGVVSSETDRVLKEGGLVLNVGLDATALAARGVKSERRRLYRVKLEGELKGTATRNMLRWRDALEMDAITEPGAECEGVWYRRGNEVFLQATSKGLAERYAKDGTRQRGVMPTVLALDLLKARVLTHLNATPETRIRRRLDTVCTAVPFRPLKEWYAYGPFLYEDAKHVASFKEIPPGEGQAISGDMNPNFTYRVDDARKTMHLEALAESTRRQTFDFRRQVLAGPDGLVDLEAAFSLGGKAAYGYLTHTWTEKEAGEAILSFAFPSKAEVYLNGEKVFSAMFLDYAKGAREPVPNTFPVRVNLRKGDNALTVKLVTLPDEMAAWRPRMGVSRAMPDVQLTDALESVKEGNLYNEKGDIGYAYRYHYW